MTYFLSVAAIVYALSGQTFSPQLNAFVNQYRDTECVATAPECKWHMDAFNPDN